MKIIVSIPMLYGSSHCKAAIESVIGRPDVDVLIGDNGADQDVKDLIANYDCLKIVEPANIYVNPIWNKFIASFLSGGWDYLIIMNSDLTPFGKWDEICRKRWLEKPDEILIPRLDEIPRNYLTAIAGAKVVTEGTPGVFITLNRKQAGMVYPIPEEIKCWFGDNWIYEILRTLGFQTVIPSNLFASHAWSSTISRVPGISEIIEEDKVAWRDIVEPKMRERIGVLRRS